MKQVVILMVLALHYTGGWIDHHMICDDLSEILNSIKADPDNYHDQQLLSAFYPINQDDQVIGVRGWQ